MKKLLKKAVNVFPLILFLSNLSLNANALESDRLEVKNGDCPALGVVFEQQCLGQPSDTRYSDYAAFIGKHMQKIKDAYPKELIFECGPISKEVENSCLSAQQIEGPSFWSIPKFSSPTTTPKDVGKETFVPPVYLLGTPKKKKK